MGLVGIALLLLALTVALARLPSAHSRLGDLQQTTATLHERLQRAAGSFDDTARTPEEQLANFYSAFPARGAAPDLLGRIYETAARHGVTLSQGEYRPKRESGSLLTRYQITLPVNGHYLKVRDFLGESLRKNPFLALDNITVQRAKINDPVVEARIQLTLYLIEGL
jgi:hypothetical protein